MDQPTITVTETPHAPAGGKPAPAENPRAADTRRASRPHEAVVATVGAAAAVPTSKGGVTHVTVSGGAAGRSFTDHQKQMLSNLDKFGDVRGGTEKAEPTKENAGTTVTVREGNRPEPTPEKKPEPAAAAPEVEKKPAPAEAKPETPETKPAPAPDAELSAARERLERMTEHNRRLVAEVERHRSTKHEPDERLKELDAIERDFVSNPIGAMRRLAALAVGAKDGSAPEVDKLLSGVYGDWTEAELKVPMDRAARAEFGTERNRLLIERDRRERERGEKAKQAEVEGETQKQRMKSAVDGLGERLKADKHVEKFPLLMEHSELFDGIAPAHLLFSAISRGISAGEFKNDTPDKDLVEHYSKEIEGYYKPRYDKLTEHFKTKLRDHFTQELEDHFKQKFAASTAPQAQASDSKTDAAADTIQAGVRTITNASASVAPPAPPQTTTPPAKDVTATPKFRSEDERRRYLAGKHFGEA